MIFNVLFVIGVFIYLSGIWKEKYLISLIGLMIMGAVAIEEGKISSAPKETAPIGEVK